MKKIVALTVLCFSMATASAFAESFTGVVADSMCAKNAAKAGSPGHAACAKKCIDGGSPAVLVVGDKVYKVSNPETLTAYAGKQVTVDASVDADTLTVKSVK